MPAESPSGQPASKRQDWFASAAGQAVLDSEDAILLRILSEGRQLPWLWCAPRSGQKPASSKIRGLRLIADNNRWIGDIRCGLTIPLATESLGVVILQHVLGRGETGTELLRECARVLIPGGRLVLCALNPLAPYRWRWRGSGLRAVEPLTWRRRLREAALVPDPISHGVGPSWRSVSVSEAQQGAGLRAAYLLGAEKRVSPLTPMPRRRRVGAAVKPVPAAGLALAFDPRQRDRDRPTLLESGARRFARRSGQ